MKKDASSEVLPFKDHEGRTHLLPANMTLEQMVRMGMWPKLADPKVPLKPNELRDACKLVNGELQPE